MKEKTRKDMCPQITQMNADKELGNKREQRKKTPCPVFLFKVLFPIQGSFI